MRYRRRLLFFVPVGLTTLGALWLVWCPIRVHGLSVLEIVFLITSTILAYHNAVGFWAGTFGFIIKLLHPPMPPDSQDMPTPHSCTGFACPLMGLPRSPHLGIRTALVMPIYNESVSRVIAGIDACALSLIRECEAKAIPLDLFELFLMSDSRDTDSL